MSEALVYAEAQGIVHRDIKPDNIMLTNGGTVKLADLGLALQLGGEEGVSEKDEKGRGKVMGTPLYMSPEQARALPVDSRSDQYSLGATLYHMLTGKPPFRGESAKAIMKAHVFDPVPDPRQINADVPELWRQLCMKLMAKNPEERFDGCPALRTAVQSAISGQAGPGPSRRVRAAGWVSAVERTGAMPGWAKMLVYGFALAVVIMVVVFNPFTGSHPATPESTKTEAPLPPPPPSAQDHAMERVLSAIKGLPSEPEKALATVVALLADQSIPAGPARERLVQEHARRKTEVDQLRRAHEETLAKARLAKVEEIQKAMAAGSLGAVKEGLQLLAPDLDKLPAPVRETVARTKQQFQLALVDVQKQFSDVLLQARHKEEVDTAMSAAKASALGDDALAALTDLAAKRTAELSKAVPVAAGDDRAQWQEFGNQIEQLRGSFSYSNIRSLAETESVKFTGESRDLVKEFIELGDLALNAEKALRKYIGNPGEHPAAEIMVGGKAQRVFLTKITAKEVSFQTTQAGGDGSLTQDRKSSALPLKELLDHTPADCFTDLPADRPRSILAFLWVWRQPEADILIAKLSNDPMVKAITTLEAKSRIIDLHARGTRSGKQVTITYDFTQKRPELLEDFVGEGAAVTANGLSWSSGKKTAKDAPERELPTLRWKEALLPPLTITSQCVLKPNNHLILIGVQAGDKRARLGFHNIPTIHSAATLFSNEAGGFMLGKGKRDYFKAGDVIKVDIAVSAEGRVTLKYNDNIISEDYLLPTGKPVTLILQSYSPNSTSASAEGEGGMDITSLSISGTLPDAH
jgi:hypothetical protein